MPITYNGMLENAINKLLNSYRTSNLFAVSEVLKGVACHAQVARSTLI